MIEPLPWRYNDGGRAAAGYRGQAGDCVVRAVAIASGMPYVEVYDLVNLVAQAERPRRGRKRSSARTGVFRGTARKTMERLGFRWTPTMGIGTGCKVHLRKGELPMGRLVVALSRHVCAVLDGVVMDTGDPGRDGTRCVYGYWSKP